MKTLPILLSGLMFVAQQMLGQSKADQQIRAMIPPGWVPISAAVGDLNGDLSNDMVILLRSVQALSAPTSIMVVWQDGSGNVSLYCNSDIAAVDQVGTGPMYDARSITIQQHTVSFKYFYYTGEATVEDEMTYSFFDGDLRLEKARQNGRIGNYAYELHNDIINGTVSITRWADVTNPSASPTLTTITRKLPEAPPLCTCDIGMFSRTMFALAQPVAEPSRPEPLPARVRSGQKMPTDGLYAYLDFNGDIGDRGPAHHETVNVGGRHVSDGYSDHTGAFELDGQSYVQIMQGSAKFAAPFTVSGWFNAKGRQQLQTVVSMGRSPDGTGFNFGYNFPDMANAFYFGLIGTEPFGIQYEMVNTGWHFACATIDSKEMKLYIDGSLVATQAVQPLQWLALQKNMRLSRQPIEIGRELATLDRYLTGTVDNVALYSRVLSEDEVNQLWNSGMER